MCRSAHGVLWSALHWLAAHAKNGGDVGSAAASGVSCTQIAPTNGQGSGLDQLDLGTSYGTVATDPWGGVYIGDNNNFRVMKWVPGEAQGTVVAGGNGEGTADNQMQRIYDMEVNSSGHILIADNKPGSFRVQAWAPGVVNGSGTTIYPGGAALDLALDAQNNLYVLWGDEVHKVPHDTVTTSLTGTVVAGGYGHGNADNQWKNHAQDVDVDAAGNIYVNDPIHGRVMQWPPGDETGYCVAGACHTSDPRPGSGPHELNTGSPAGMKVDYQNSIWLTDTYNNRVVRWQEGAEDQDIMLDTGDVTPSLYHPRGIAFDSSYGKFYVTDKRNRVLECTSGLATITSTITSTTTASTSTATTSTTSSATTTTTWTETSTATATSTDTITTSTRTTTATTTSRTSSTATRSTSTATISSSTRTTTTRTRVTRTFTATSSTRTSSTRTVGSTTSRAVTTSSSGAHTTSAATTLSGSVSAGSSTSRATGSVTVQSSSTTRAASSTSRSATAPSSTVWSSPESTTSLHATGSLTAQSTGAASSTARSAPSSTTGASPEVASSGVVDSTTLHSAVGETSSPADVSVSSAASSADGTTRTTTTVAVPAAATVTYVPTSNAAWAANISALAAGLEARMPGLQEVVGGAAGATSIIDTGRGWYVDGNRLQVAATSGAGGLEWSGVLPYNQECGGGGNKTGVADIVYFTCKASPRVWLAGFYSPSGSLAGLRVQGISGGGETPMVGLHAGQEEGFSGFSKQVFGAQSHSINQLLVVPKPGWTVGATASSTDLQAGEPVGMLFYVRWAGPEGQRFAGDDFSAALRLVVAHFPRRPPLATSPAKQAGAFLDTAKSASAALLEGFADSGVAKKTEVLPGGGVAVAAKLGSPNAGETVTVEVVDAVKISVPSSALSGLDVPAGDEVALTAVAFEPDETQAGVEETVAAAMSIELQFLRSNRTASVSGLAEPIAITMPVNASAGMYCAFWDESLQSWSSAGVWPSPDNVPGGPMACLTSHLSLFAVLWQGFVATWTCLQFTLIEAVAVRQIAKGDWHQSKATMMLWGVLAMLFAIFLVGVYLDHHQSRTCSWTNAWFLLPEHDGPPADGEVRGDEEVGPTMTAMSTTVSTTTSVSVATKVTVRSFCGTCIHTCVACCGSFCQHLVGSSAARDAVDDIVSSWWNEFSDVRSFLESFCEGMDLGIPDMGALAGSSNSRVVNIGMRIMCDVTLSTCRHLSAARMGVSEEVVSCLLSDEDVRDLLVAHNKNMRNFRAMHPRHIWQKATRGEVWISLHEHVSHHMKGTMFSLTEWSSLLRIAVKLFAFHTPFGHVWAFDIFIPRALRAFLFAIEVVGSFALCCAFFQANGYVTSSRNRDRPWCHESLQSDIRFKFGRLLAIALGSLLLAGLPAGFLASLHTPQFKKLEYEGCPGWERQLQAWRLQDRLIWILGSLYLMLGIFFIHLFLANVIEQDRQDWFTSAVISVGNSFVVLPAMLAVIAPLLARGMIGIFCVLTRLECKLVLRAMHRKLLAESNLMLPLMQI